MAAGVVSFIAHFLMCSACHTSIITHLAPVFCLSPAKEALVQVSREISNKVFPNLNHDAQHLLPGFYYYIGLQVEVKFFSTYSAFLEKNLEYWDWSVYDGFGHKMLNAGVADTRNDAVALAQNWVV